MRGPRMFIPVVSGSGSVECLRRRAARSRTARSPVGGGVPGAARCSRVAVSGNHGRSDGSDGQRTAQLARDVADADGRGGRAGVRARLGRGGGGDWRNECGGYSVLATAAEWALHATDLLVPTMRSSSVVLNALLLIAAGIYQFLPIKNVCLSKCRLPLGFLLTEWRDGWTGAVTMGLRHGAFCVGCCWLLMALL